MLAVIGSETKAQRFHVVIAGPRHRQPAIVLLDLLLPDIDGWEVCRRLKADDRTKAIPIVILTAHYEPHAARRADEAGCVAYLLKPCGPAELVAVIKRVLAEQASV